jgi:hypothetical protein
VAFGRSQDSGDAEWPVDPGFVRAKRGGREVVQTQVRLERRGGPAVDHLDAVVPPPQALGLVQQGGGAGRVRDLQAAALVQPGGDGFAVEVGQDVVTQAAVGHHPGGVEAVVVQWRLVVRVDPGEGAGGGAPAGGPGVQHDHPGAGPGQTVGDVGAHDSGPGDDDVR